MTTTSSPVNTQQPPRAVVRRIVELATRAPSVHNTQPWLWRTDGDCLLLHADRSRHLRAEDPVGRNLTISCGAALHHAQVAAAALGWETDARLVPDGPSSTLLGSLSFTWTGEPRQAGDLFERIEARRTDRRRFTSWPVPDERLQHLADEAREWGTRATPIVEVTERFKLERIAKRADDRQRRDEQRHGEQQSWVDRNAADGVPSQLLPSNRAWHDRFPTRFPAGRLDDTNAELEGSDGVIVLYDVADDQAAWLRAGQGLSALWLRAAGEGLSVVPLSQVIEVAETREALRRDVMAGLAEPLLLVRVGWQAIGRSELPPSPRRPLDEVLDPH